jgi:hypothetical protein
MFLVRADRLVGWRATGFEADLNVRALEVRLESEGLLARAVKEGVPASTSGTAPGDASAATPFGSPSAADVGLAVPIRVGGVAVAVIYADDAGSAGEAPKVWPGIVEVLARHAARCLEVLPFTRAVQPAAAIPEMAPAPRYAAQRRQPASAIEGDEDAARRYARLLVSEIKLYHESAVTEGRQARNLLQRLRPEIERARRLYEERVPAAIRAKADYFGQELVRTLANGDASLLGAR